MNRPTLVQTISAYALAIFGISSTALLNSGTPDAIRHQGFQDFIRGTPGNSGQNVYVSSRGRVEVINKWDLNADGYNDVLISNDHNNFEVVDAFIYWNSASGFRSLLPSLWREMPLAQVAFDLMDRRGGITRLPAFGGGRSVIADLNRDGYPDIVFCNYIHYYPGLRNAFVYWGGPDGYSATNRTELPTNWASGVAAADLNGDGYPELVFANHGTEAGLEEISPDVGQESYIYWGSATGYAPYLRSSLQTFGAASVNVTDLNGDGRADIVFVNQYSGMFNGRVNTHIFWGNPHHYYSNASMSSLPGHGAYDTTVADLNQDGYPDIVLSNSYIDKSHVYWGGRDGFSPERRTELPIGRVFCSSAADLNRDGYLGLVFSGSEGGRMGRHDSLGICIRIRGVAQDRVHVENAAWLDAFCRRSEPRRLPGLDLPRRVLWHHADLLGRSPRDTPKRAPGRARFPAGTCSLQI